MTDETRVFAYLRRRGEATTGSICSQTELPEADVLAVLETALITGLVTERRRSEHVNAPRYWAAARG